MNTWLLETCRVSKKKTYRERIVRQVICFQELYRDARSAKHESNAKHFAKHPVGFYEAHYVLD